MSLLVCVLLGLFIGAAMGFTGAGGGILAVPALVASMGWSMQQAAPVALVAVAVAAAAGAVQGLRHNLVRYRAALLMAVVSLPFSALGVALAHRLSQRMLMGLFAVVMLATAIRLLRSPLRQDGVATTLPARRGGNIDPITGRFAWSWPTAARLGGIGALAGLASGLLGVSGGFIVVPLLKGFTALGMQAVVSTSLLVTALIGSGAAANALLHGADLPMPITAAFAAATMLGVLVARRLTRHAPQRRLQQGFAVLLMIVAARMAWQAVR